MERVKLVGEYCKNFRVYILCETLRFVCSKTDTNLKTLSAFEMGRSNNMEHIFKYVDCCRGSQKTKFLDGLSKIVGGEQC